VEDDTRNAELIRVDLSEPLEKENQTNKQTKPQVLLRTTKFAAGKSLRFFELFLELYLFEFRFLSSEWSGFMNPHLEFFQTVKGKAPKEAWGSHLSGEGINATFLHPHEPQLSAVCCINWNQIDPTYIFASDLL